MPRFNISSSQKINVPTFVTTPQKMNLLAPTQSRRSLNGIPSPVFIPDEHITDIFSLLPVKSLLRFRCLSKSHDSLISSPAFVKLHLTRYACNADLTLLSTSDNSVLSFTVFRLLQNPPIIFNIPEDSYYQLEDKHCLDIVGSCNGLLCLFGHSFTDNFKIETWIHFWNPATRKISEKLGYTLHNNLHFHHSLAFGYVNSTDTYKVAYLVPNTNNVRVFSLGDNVWRNIQNSPVDHGYRMNVVNLGNSLNWLPIRNYHSHYDCNNITIQQFVIISLHLGTETHSQLLPPQGFTEVPIVVPYISVLKDCLCFSHDYKQTHFVIWAMKEFGVEDSWTQLYKISYDILQVYDHLNDSEFHLFPLFLSEKTGTLLLTNDLESSTIIYNWRYNRVQRINKPWFNGMNYVESLVSHC